MSTVVEAQNVSYSYDGQHPVLQDISFRISPGQKVALVGSNGAGKSTLLGLLAGRLTPDGGQLHIRGTVQYLEQQGALHHDANSPESLRDSSSSSPAVENLTVREWLDEQCALGLLDFEVVHRILRALHLPGEQRLETLSAGQQSKLAMAASALRPGVELVLMDEPTAHMELRGAMFLRSLLREMPAAVVVVSHDPNLLEGSVDMVLELDAGHRGMRSASSSYADYLVEKERRKARLEAEAAARQRKVQALKTNIASMQVHGAMGTRHVMKDRDKILRDFRRERAGRTLTAAGVQRRRMERVLEDMEDAKAQNWKGDSLSAKFSEDGSSSSPHAPSSSMASSTAADGCWAVELSEAWVGYPSSSSAANKAVDESERFDLSNDSPRRRHHEEKEEEEENTLGPITLAVAPGEHVALVGVNGSGKSSLLLAVSGRHPLRKGQLRLGPRTKMFFLSQDGLSGESTPRELLAKALEDTPLRPESQVARLVQAGITFDMADKPTSTLSPGLQARLAVLLLTCSNANLLLLDEITNFMDAAARQAVVDYLRGFQGTVLCVTHDMDLLERLQWDRVLELVRVSEPGESLHLYDVEDLDEWKESAILDAEASADILFSDT